jgi:hypothetical protein
MMYRSIEQPALYWYDQLTFSCFQILYRCELASQATINQLTGVFATDWLLTGRLQVRILFEEPITQKSHETHSNSLEWVSWLLQPGITG